MPSEAEKAPTETPESKGNQEMYILIFEMIVIGLCFLLLIIHFFMFPVVDDFSPAFGALPSLGTPSPPDMRRPSEKTVNNERKVGLGGNSRDTDVEIVHHHTEDKIENVTVPWIELNISTPTIPTSTEKTNQTTVILRHSTTAKLKQKKYGKTDPFMHTSHPTNVSFVENKFRRKFIYTSNADSRMANNQTLISSLLIMYPCVVTGFIVVSMRLTAILSNDPLHRTTKWCLIIFCFGLGTAIFATSVRSLIGQDTATLIIIAVVAVVLILTEVAHFCLLSVRAWKM